jgi:hypothetical protein
MPTISGQNNFGQSNMMKNAMNGSIYGYPQEAVDNNDSLMMQNENLLENESDLMVK